MKKSNFDEEQIAFALKRTETGTLVADVPRRMGISEQTFYRCRKLEGGLGTGKLRRLKHTSVCRLYRDGGLSLRLTRPSSSRRTGTRCAAWRKPRSYATGSAG